MSAADDGVQYGAPPLRICSEDGTHHFSHVKKLALSGVQYLHAVNNPVEPTRDMLIGTAVHRILLGPRPGAKDLVVYRGGIRRGKEWDSFLAANVGKEILTASEWEEAEQIAAGVLASPVAKRRLEGARFEVPLVWDEAGVRCSTSGLDILCPNGDIADLKTCPTTFPPAWQAHAVRMLYPMQLAWYRRGARANGIAVRGLFVLGVERKAPHEVVELELTDELIDFADRTIDLWLSKLRTYRAMNPEPRTVYDWPGYAEAPVKWQPPAWAEDGDDYEDTAA